MPRLIVKQGPDTGASLELPRGQKIFIGRGSDTNFRLHDPRASRKHCMMGTKGGRWLLKNLEPANGTHINGRMIEADELLEIKDGDRIEIGNSLFVFLDEENSRDDPLIGQIIDSYHIHRELGRGATGVVYHATQVELGREVAIKTLMPEMAVDDEYKRRFYQEARSTAAAAHPNILPVYQAGELLGLPYFSIEFAPHGSCYDEARTAQRMRIARVLEIAQHVLGALIFLEELGVVHRDLKPHNIFCFPKGVVKLGDMGLAVPAEEVATQRGGMLGTPHYVSPEQARGHPMDHRADLYSFGATLYRIIAGRPMFTAASSREIALAQLKDLAPPLSTYRENVPPQLELIVERLLMKNPDDRFQSARAVLDALGYVQPPIEDDVPQAQMGAPNIHPTSMGTDGATPGHSQ